MADHWTIARESTRSIHDPPISSSWVVIPPGRRTPETWVHGEDIFMEREHNEWVDRDAQAKAQARADRLNAFQTVRQVLHDEGVTFSSRLPIYSYQRDIFLDEVAYVVVDALHKIREANQ